MHISGVSCLRPLELLGPKPKATPNVCLLWHCSLAVSANAEKKPVWLCIQAFEGTAGPRFYWTMPTERQLRAQAFAGIIHGAT